jgi:hypothetical protein
MKKASEPATPSAHIEQLEEPRRSEIKALHELIQSAAPHLPPSIQAGMIGYGTYHYKYASGHEGDAPIVALSSRKNYISVYVSASEDGEYLAERYKAELPKANIGKSCIRFKRVSDIHTEVLTKIVKLGVRAMEKAHSQAAS